MITEMADIMVIFILYVGRTEFGTNLVHDTLVRVKQLYHKFCLEQSNRVFLQFQNSVMDDSGDDSFRSTKAKKPQRGLLITKNPGSPMYER